MEILKTKVWIIKAITILGAIYMLQTKSQMTIILIILITCLALSIYMFLISLVNWFRLFLLILYIRGIIVLFMFIVSIAPNEKSLLKSQKNKKGIIIIIAFFMLPKIRCSLENIKISSSLQSRILLLSLIMIIICIIAYLPPKITKAIYKGMKSSK